MLVHDKGGRKRKNGGGRGEDVERDVGRHRGRGDGEGGGCVLLITLLHTIGGMGVLGSFYECFKRYFKFAVRLMCRTLLNNKMYFSCIFIHNVLGMEMAHIQ